MDSFLPGETRIVDYKTGHVEEKDVDINDSNALATADALFGDNNKTRPKIAFQMFLYDFLASRDPKLGGNVLVNSVYQPARLFTEGVRNVPACKAFNDEVEKRLYVLLAEIKDKGTPWRRTSDEKTCSYCDFKMICGR